MGIKLDVGPWSWLLCSPLGTHAKWATNFKQSLRDYTDRIEGNESAVENVKSFQQEMTKEHKKIAADICGYLIRFKIFFNISLPSVDVTTLITIVLLVLLVPSEF